MKKILLSSLATLSIAASIGGSALAQEVQVTPTSLTASNVWTIHTYHVVGGTKGWSIPSFGQVSFQLVEGSSSGLKFENNYIYFLKPGYYVVNIYNSSGTLIEINQLTVT
ncbi:hypothetical protein YDYSY3_31200 [Paenibacillus chitinolyticus]|uniref:hypothetical protein n=1 Tax=Paenibacillus chitinolyticus TaxID=79263 RepID=UPI0026E4AB0D|nr:hypothetical protein [Paenibacillus chitinolyticus]GKS12120.1 hypothetical protein YDYSY3_31200 [Paenibacillus chitinolyticus]